MIQNILQFGTCLIVFLSLTIYAQGQQHEADSLSKLLETDLPVDKSAEIGLRLSKIYERTDLIKAKHFANMALRTTNDSIRSEAYNQLGRSFFYSNQLDSAETYFQNSVKSLKKANLDEMVASIQISLGAVQLRKGSYKKAVETLISSASFFEERKDSLNMGKCYSNISSAFGELNNYPKAIEYGQKALQIFNAKGIVQFQIITLPNLAGYFL